MSWRLDVDIGGTFTDLVLNEDAGAVAVVKVPSTPGDFSRGVLDALDVAVRAGPSLGTARPRRPAATACYREVRRIQ